MSFGVFEVSFGAEFRNMVRDSFGSGHGQFRSHTVVILRSRPARIELGLRASPPETDGLASRN